MKIVIKYITMQLITFNCIAQFNTVKPWKEPEIRAKDSTVIIVLDTITTVARNLDSLSGRLVYQQFLKDKEQPSQPHFFSPLTSLSYSSPFGVRFHPLEKKWKLHAGVDLKASSEPVYSIADGIVKTATYSEREGNYIVIIHNDMESIYCHLALIICKPGERLQGGSCIGISGSTGSVTGPHLHFGIKYRGNAINPMIFLSNIIRLNKKTSH